MDPNSGASDKFFLREELKATEGDSGRHHLTSLLHFIKIRECHKTYFCCCCQFLRGISLLRLTNFISLPCPRMDGFLLRVVLARISSPFIFVYHGAGQPELSSTSFYACDYKKCMCKGYIRFVMGHGKARQD